jgi:hypothetical protein
LNFRWPGLANESTGCPGNSEFQIDNKQNFSIRAGGWWLMPVILASLEAEIGKILV